MASVNKVILIGNLGRDPETRYTTGGDAVTNLRIATTDTWKDKAGEKQEKTEWHTRRAVRAPGRDRRRIPEEGPPGLYRGPPADAQVHRQGRRREVLDRNRRRPHAAARQPDGGAAAAVATPSSPAAASAGGGARRGGAGGSGGGGSAKRGGAAKKNVDDFDDDIPF